ncbi:Co-chaperone [Seminavis robusta]|uniref:Co-chaperone n=1 Tax=Seminavis robusta TaxID=568900 RepID=A0A9N8EP55_9STRA|nr:Co-chaperone [Seminavis robusta]|eukprot:Sro1323_g262690.1 Co-chaperone (227) ;mRNA; r:21016-21696
MWSVSAAITKNCANRVFRSPVATSVSKTVALRWSSAAASSEDSSRNDNNAPVDAFTLLNLDRRFDISQDELKQSYRRLMAQFHPDKHHGKPLAEQQALSEQATLVTRSYQILQQDSTRATHMLQLLGKVEDTFDESSLQELLGSSPASSMLLMQVMEIREAIEEAGSDQAKLQSLSEENNTRMQEVGEELAQAFDAQDLDKAVELTIMLQYYSRIEETIRDNMEIS